MCILHLSLSLLIEWPIDWYNICEILSPEYINSRSKMKTHIFSFWDYVAEWVSTHLILIITEKQCKGIRELVLLAMSGCMSDVLIFSPFFFLLLTEESFLKVTYFMNTKLVPWEAYLLFLTWLEQWYLSKNIV